MADTSCMSEHLNVSPSGSNQKPTWCLERIAARSLLGYSEGMPAGIQTPQNPLLGGEDVPALIGADGPSLRGLTTASSVFLFYWFRKWCSNKFNTTRMRIFWAYHRIVNLCRSPWSMRISNAIFCIPPCQRLFRWNLCWSWWGGSA